MKNKIAGRKGVTFISLVVAVFIMSVGITAILRVFPVISRLGERAKNNVSVSLVADRVFTVIEMVYGSESGPPVPGHIYGRDTEFPRYSYRADITEERENLYSVEVDVFWKREGKVESRYFFGRFTRK